MKAWGFSLTSIRSRRCALYSGQRHLGRLGCEPRGGLADRARALPKAPKPIAFAPMWQVEGHASAGCVRHGMQADHQARLGRNGAGRAWSGPRYRWIRDQKALLHIGTNWIQLDKHSGGARSLPGKYLET